MLRGFINIDKPQGVTSFDVVRRIRRAAATRKVGHAGTLDPNATGVLPIALGEATRLVDELVGARKRYTAGIVFGQSTDTYDVEGDVTGERDASHLDDSAVREALAAFVGEIQQAPPAYSAVKRDGVTAYRAARAGNPLELEPRPVVAYVIEVIGFDRTNPTRPTAIVDVQCGKGFYVRSLAHEVGEQLGVGAHLGTLRRTQVGLFLADDAVPLDVAVERLETGDTVGLLHPPDFVLDAWPSVVASDEMVASVRRGVDIPAQIVVPEGVEEHGPRELRARCYDTNGALVALLRPGRLPGEWHPFRVFSASPDKGEPDPRNDTVSQSRFAPR